MSVERVACKDGSVVWRVRWRQGGRNRSKVLGRKRDAEAFDAELIRRKRTGELAQLDAGKEQLADFGEEWWRLYAEPNLARSTLQVYAVQWDAHILPRLGSLPLRELTPDVVNRFRLAGWTRTTTSSCATRRSSPSGGRRPTWAARSAGGTKLARGRRGTEQAENGMRDWVRWVR